MPDPNLSFGLVIQAAAKGFPEEVMADPTKAGQALMQANDRLIELSRPHFDTIWAEDHFQWGARPMVEAITTLSYLVGKYPGMRFGNIVLGQSYRNPALTAKMAANLQLLSGGNFILGIGAGWKEDEYTAYGYPCPYPSAGQRIDELDEAVQIIRAMWTESPATCEGKYYHIENAYCSPQPNPPIPLLIAGQGEKKLLRVVAKYADWWNAPFMQPDEYAHKQQVLAEHCMEIGRDPAEIYNTYYALVSLATDRSKTDQINPDFIAGTPDDVTEVLSQFVKLGVKHFQIRLTDFPSTDGLELFIEKVLPRLKE